MPDEKKYLKQWRDGNDLYYFYDEDAHTELNAVSSALEANKIFATIKSVPTHGIVTMVDGTQLNVKDTLLVSKSNGLGQVNFRIKMDDGFKEKVTVKDNEGYKNIKSEVLEDGTVEYKITKIFDEIEILITEEEITEDGYRVNFIGENFTIKVLSQDYNGSNDYFIDPEINTVTEKRTYTRNYKNGGMYAKYSAEVSDDASTPDIDESKLEVKPQIQFIIIPNEGYDIIGKPVISGTYNNDKSGLSADGKYYIYKYTVIKSDINIEIKTEASNKTLADYHITNAYTKTETDEKFVEKSVISNICNGEGNGSIAQSPFIYQKDENSEAILLEGASATGLNAVAFGGARYDKPEVGITTAAGNQSIAAGGAAQALGDFSVSMGQNTYAFGKCSVAFGGRNMSGSLSKNSEYSYTFTAGYNNEASTKFSSAFGEGNKSSSEHQFLCGSFNDCGIDYELSDDPNIIDPIPVYKKQDRVFLVGNGTSAQKSTAFEVLKDGRAKVQAAPQEDDDVVRYQEIKNMVLMPAPPTNPPGLYMLKVTTPNGGDPVYSWWCYEDDSSANENRPSDT